MSSLKIFKLVGGEDIIGFLESYNNEDLEQIDPDAEEGSEEYSIAYDRLVFIRDPMKMYWNYDPKKKRHELFLTKWIAFSDDNLFVIPKELVLTIATPTDIVIKHYEDTAIEEFPNVVPEKELTEEEVLDQHYKKFLKTWDPFEKESDEDKKKKMN